MATVKPNGCYCNGSKEMFYNYSLLKRIFILSAVLGTVFVHNVFAQPASPLTMPGKTALYQRVLAVPGALISADIRNPSVQTTAVTPFSIFYVYARQTTESGEWLQVGIDSNGTIHGWLPSSQTVQWNQTLTVGFKDPATQPRIILFGERGPLKTLVDTSDASTYDDLRQRAIAGITANSPVNAVQPEGYIDIRRSFYLVPILSHEDVLINGYQGRLLHVATVPLQKPRPARDYRAGIVFVIDTTISMGPYIDSTRATMQGVYDAINNAELSNKVSFGLIGYRDNLKAAPGLEYLSRIYSSLSEGISGDVFLDNIKSVLPAIVSSQGFNEDAYAGIKRAIEDMDWEPYEARYVILITDAGPRSSNDPLSATGMDAESLRRLALDNDISLWVMHLKTPEGTANHDHAANEYKHLSQITGIGDFYYGVETGDVDSFEQALRAMTAQLTQQVADTARGVPPLRVTEDDEINDELVTFQQKVAKLGYALQMRYLQKNRADAIPALFDAWLIDRDFDNPAIRSLDVRVLLTRDQLSDLHEVLRQVLITAEEGAMAPQDFLDDLKSLAATISRNPEAATNATRAASGQSLADLGYMREYIEGLPYTSEVMDLDLSMWQDWSAQQQFEFINQLDSKVAYYRAMHDNVDLWVSLDDGPVDGDSVYPLLLEALP
jgi:serine/threonine-protein kinase PpkA